MLILCNVFEPQGKHSGHRPIKAGERIQDLDGVFECIGGNDLNVPYFRRVGYYGWLTGPKITIDWCSRELYYVNE